MKKIYLSALAIMAVTTMAVAQQEGNVDNGFLRGTFHKNVSGQRAATDTLGIGSTATALTTSPVFAPSSQVYTFSYTGGGYVFGVNVSGNNLNEIAQGYAYTGAAKVEGVVMLACGKTVGAGHNASAAFNVRVYNWSATGATFYVASPGTPYQVAGPTTTKGSVSYLFDDLDTNFLTFNVATFATPLVVSNDFAVGAEYATLKNTNNDTIGFHCDAPGDAGGLNYAFHKIGSTWYVTNSIFTSGQLDVNIALFPIIQNTTSIEEASYFNGMKMWQNYPNPVNDLTTINYQLERGTSELKMKVLDMKGAVVAAYELGNKPAGKHSFNLSAAGLESGTYYFMLTNDSGTLTQKFVVER